MNKEILQQDYTKFYLRLRDKITFEIEMDKAEIPFYCDIENKYSSGELRYYVLTKDRQKIDEIKVKHGIASSTDSIPTYYVEEEKQKFIMFVFIAFIFLITVLTFYLINKND